jgi:hypothetical protein
MPWCSDGPSEAELGGHVETTLAHWADACRAQGGWVVIPHLPNPNCEPAVLIATGRADAVEFLVSNEYNHHEYYRYLNCGYRLPLVGGTDKMTADVPVGIYRTYTHIPADEEFTYDAWCRRMAEGRTFLSAGPLLRFTADGAMIGDTLRLARGGGTVEVAADADCIFPIHRLEIVLNGQVVAATEEEGGAARLSLRARIPVTGHSWLAARVSGPGYFRHTKHLDGWGRGIIAHTSPIYVAAGEEWRMFDLDTARYMLTLVEGGISYLRHSAPHAEPGQVTHHHGLEDHMAFLEGPFHEAADAIHRRMHDLGIPH